MQTVTKISLMALEKRYAATVFELLILYIIKGVVVKAMLFIFMKSEYDTFLMQKYTIIKVYTRFFS